MPQHLIKQHRHWYVTRRIPTAVRHRFDGKVRLTKSLGTDSLREAHRRKYAVLAEWEALFALGGPSAHSGGSVKGVTKPSSKFNLLTHIDEYESTLTTIQPKSKDMRLADIRRFIEQFPYAEDAVPIAVRRWVEGHLIGKLQLSASTLKRLRTNTNLYWKYLVDRHELSAPEPFGGLSEVRVKSRKQEAADRRRHFEPRDFQKLISATDDQNLQNLIRIGAYTGMRIEEICSLRTDDVSEGRIVVRDAKTKAGWRVVPIHPEISDLIHNLQRSSMDGYVLSGLNAKNKYGIRSDAIGKKFGRLKSSLGYGPEFVFHSFRKGVATQLEASLVPENISAVILGHSIPTMTYGIYSGNTFDYSILLESIGNLRW